MIKIDKQEFQNVADCIPVAIFIYKMVGDEVRVIYTNAYYRSLPYAAEQEIMNMDANGLLNLIHRDEREQAQLFLKKVFHELQSAEITYRSLAGNSSEYRWYHLSARPIEQSDGSILAYVVFTDIDNEKKAEIKAIKNELMYRLISEKAKQIVFEYDRDNNRIIYQMDNAYTRQICQAQGMSEIVDNVPDSLVSMVDEKYRSVFLSFFDKHIDTNVKRDIEYSSVVDGATHWWRLSAIPVIDSQGHVITIYCCAQDISDLKNEQQQYLDFFESLDRAYPNNLGSFHLNLTKNICVDGKSPIAFVAKQKESGTVDGYFAEFAKLIYDDKTLQYFEKTFNRQHLIEMFNQGQTSIKFPYSIKYPDGIRWREGILVMHRNPRNDDIEAVTYAIDIDSQKRGEMILERMSRESCDFVGYIDVTSKTFILHSGIWENPIIKVNERKPYLECVRQLSGYCINEESKQKFEDSAALDKLEKVLQTKNEYSLVYDFKENDRILKKQLVFKWLDKENNEILTVQSDVSEVWAQEQDRLVRNEEANILKDTVSNVPIGIMVLRNENHKLEPIAKNNQLNALLGEGEKNRHAFYARVHPDDVKKCQEAFENISESKHSINIEFRYYLGNTKFPYWYRMMLNGAPRNHSSLIYCCLFDISAEMAMEEIKVAKQRQEIQKYQSQLQVMASANTNFAASYHLNLTKNICTDMIVQDQKYSQLKQLSATGSVDGLFKATAETIVDEEIRKHVLVTYNCKNLIECFNRGETKISIEYPCRSVRGGVRWISGTINLVFNPETRDIEGITYAVDIDDMKKHEFVTKHVAQQEFEYIGLLYLNSEEIELIQKKAHIEYPNLGQKIDYHLRRNYVCQGFSNQQECDAYRRATDIEKIKQTLNAENNYTITYFKTNANGERNCQQIRFSWLDEVHQIACIVQTDVTIGYEHEEKQIKTIQNALMEAEQANSAKSDFVSRISHDIRTPIGAISNITKFAFEDINNPQRLKDDLKKIQTSNEFLLSLINYVLDISKIDSGKIELRPQASLYANFSSSIKNMFEPLCKDKGIEFIVDDCLDAEAIYIDGVRFNQLAMNLISNAVKYTPSGGKVKVTSKIKVLPSGMGDCYLIVSDTGIGMSKAFQKNMFEPFTQEENNPYREKATSGSGLGLSLVRKLVDLMDGTISVDSDIGCGCEISVNFKARIAKDEEVESSVTEDNCQNADNPLQGRILLAEDNDINAEIEKRILETLGLTSDRAENGQKAIELFQEAPRDTYCAILMDIQMPIMNGYETTSALRRLERPDAQSIPIIAMTADAFSAAIEHSKSVGMNGYVTKPLDVKLLRETIAKFIK